MLMTRRVQMMMAAVVIVSCIGVRLQAQSPAPQLETVGVPVPETAIPATNFWRDGNLLYGEAVKPGEGENRGPFFAYDVVRKQLVYSGNEDIHTGFRCVIVDRSGNAYFSVNETGLARYDPRTNSVTVLNVTLPGRLRASTAQSSDGWIYGATNRPQNRIFRFHPETSRVEDIGSSWDYTASMVLDPTERFVYFIPGAHGGSYRLGTPVVQFDVRTRQHKVIAFLNGFYESQYRYRLGGTYAIDLSDDGRRLFINMNAVDLRRDARATSGFGDPAVVVVHIPATEITDQSIAPLAFRDVGAQTGVRELLWNAYIHTSSWGDVNNDGWPDLFAGTFYGSNTPVSNRLLINVGGAFRDGAQPEVERRGRASGSVFADFDDDGDLDLFVSNNRINGLAGVGAETSRLYRNDSGTFRDVTEGSGVGAQSSNGRQVGVLDYDNDGALDLFIVADALRGSGPTVLLRNAGSFRFVDATRAAGLPDDIHGLGLAIGDVNGDGRPDIFIAGGPNNTNTNRNYLFLNSGGGTYRRGEDAVFDWQRFTSGGEDWVSGAAFGDVNRDGRLDLLVGHHFGSSAAKGIGVPLRLYLNRGVDSGANPRFEDVTDKAALPKLVSKSPHVEIGDFDNDGWPDLYTSVKIRTATGDAPLVLRNKGVAGDPAFDVPEIVDPHYYAGGPVTDFDRDGRLDIFLAEWRSTLQGTSQSQGVVPSLLMRNVGATGNWVEVRVAAGAGRMGLGAKVKIYEGGRSGDPLALVGYGEITSGFGFSSSGMAVAHFGLGSRSEIDLVVEMPFGGEVYSRNRVAANQQITVPFAVPPAHLGLEATGTTVSSPEFLLPPAGASLPAHTVAAAPPRVEFVAYPRPPYNGKPWSQWGGSELASNGRFYSAIGDHLGIDGNAYLYEYDPATQRIRAIGDALTAVGHIRGKPGHGKIHGMINQAADGYLYMTTYWGQREDAQFDDAYRGGVILRYPVANITAPLETPRRRAVR